MFREVSVEAKWFDEGHVSLWTAFGMQQWAEVVFVSKCNLFGYTDQL